MRKLRMVPLVVVPLLLIGAWFVGGGLIDGPSPDLGAPVVLTIATVATSTTVFSEPATTDATVIDDSIPEIVVDAPIEPETPPDAGSPAFYPTCPAGRNDDGYVVDAEDNVDDSGDSDAGAVGEPGDDRIDDAADAARDRLEDLCDE